MNYRAVVNILGRLLILESATMSLPLFVSLFYKQGDSMAFAASVIITAFFGLGLFLLTKNNSLSPNENIREGIAIVSFGWILVSLFGSLPYIFSGHFPSAADAFFETISGFTTTGASVLSDVEILPYGILFWRCFTNWIGGMGILVFTLALLPAVGVGGFQIFKAETSGLVHDKIVPRIKDTAKILCGILIGLTLLMILLLIAGGMSLFDAAVHSFAAMGTGGFSTKNASIGAYNSTYIQIVIALFMLVGGTSFSMHYSLLKGKWKQYLEDREFRFYLGVIVVSTVLIALNLRSTIYSDSFASFRDSLFQVSSLITTTGFSNTNYENWPAFSKSILFILMFIGGCSGSTAGAIKNIRVLVLLKLIKRETIRVFHPRAVMPVKVGNKTIQPDTLTSVTAFFGLYLLLFAAGTVVISLEGMDFTSSASAVASALGNIGPGFGKVGPAMNYGHLSAFSKLFLSFLMLLGRLELFTLGALFSRKYWTDKT